MRINRVQVHDVRFPTSRTLDGSDAMHHSPDYSAAYVVLETDDEAISGHGLTFTNGRGTEVCVAAVRALEPLVVGRSLDGICNDMRGFWRSLVSDGQLRWLGPEKGVMHLAVAAVVNAVWDLRAKQAGVPLWLLLARLSPEELVSAIDFRYIQDALAEDEALDLLRQAEGGKERRQQEIIASGYPAYTTSAGWLGYDDDKVVALARAALTDGFRHVKMKVGADLATDTRRAALLSDVLAPDGVLMMDANQVWGVREAVERMAVLRKFDPWWIEEPTSPDDVLGHARIRAEIAPVRVATGEHVQNRIIFKQLFQANAIDVCQIDACRVAGVNEVLAIVLMAAKFAVPVCPHAGGVGLCEYVQHLAVFDYIAVSGTLQDRVVEWVDHLHEHFVHPAVVEHGRYRAPLDAGYSIEMRPESLRDFSFPDGPVWSGSSPTAQETRHQVAGPVAAPHRGARQDQCLWTPTTISGAPRHLPQPWITDDMSPLARAFEPEDLGQPIAAAGTTQTVLVQSTGDAPQMNDGPGRATDQALGKIKELISSGEFTAGARLPTERELTQRFGVSRSSLREAVRALTLVGVLEPRVGDGTYVTTLEPDLLLTGIGFVSELANPGSLLEIHQVRRLLESEATRLATPRLTDEDLAHLEAWVQRMERAGSVDEFIEADTAFHNVIFSACGNNTLASLIQNLSSGTIRARMWQSIVARGAIEATLASHRNIYHALRSRDAGQAAAADVVHLAIAGEWLQRLLAQGDLGPVSSRVR